MKKLLLFLFIATCSLQPAHAADVKISQLPIGLASVTTASDSFPYVNSTTANTERMDLWDIINLPVLQTEFSTLVPSQGGHSGQCLQSNGTNTLWAACSPVSASSATFLAGPTSGSAALPTFRAIATTDLPLIPITGGGTNVSSQTSNGVAYFDGTSVTTNSTLTWNGSQLTAKTVDNHGGVHLESQSGSGEASLSLEPGSGNIGSTGQWILYTNGSGLNSSNDFAVYDSQLSSLALVLQSSTANLGVGTNNPAYKIDDNGTFHAAGNVTLSGTGNSVGTVTSGIWNGTAIAATYGGTGVNTSASTGVPSISSGTWSVNSSLPVTLGGTADSSFTAYAPISGGTTSTGALQSASVNLSSSGYLFTTNGSSTLPSFQQLNLANSSALTGVLPFSHGGLGISTGVSGGIPYFSSTNAVSSSQVLATNLVVLGGGAGNTPITVVSTGTSGQVLTSNGGSSPPTFQTTSATPPNSGFAAHLSTNTSTAPETIVYDVADYNVSSQYNTSTGIWTVPSSGKWSVTMCFAYAAQTVATDRFDMWGITTNDSSFLIVGQAIIPVMATSQASGFCGTNIFNLTSGATYSFIDGGNRLNTWAGATTLTNDLNTPVTYVAVTFLGS